MNIKLDITTFKQDVTDALEKGLLATFLDLTTDEGVDKAKEMAKGFADEAGPSLAEAIEKFIKTGSVIPDDPAIPHTFTVIGTSPAGPVSGTATGNITQKYKMQ